MTKLKAGRRLWSRDYDGGLRLEVRSMCKRLKREDKRQHVVSSIQNKQNMDVPYSIIYLMRRGADCCL